MVMRTTPFFVHAPDEELTTSTPFAMELSAAWFVETSPAVFPVMP